MYSTDSVSLSDEELGQRRRIAELEAENKRLQSRLDQSEQSRKIQDEQVEQTRRSYESELAFLREQLAVFKEDFETERQLRQSAEERVQQLQSELTIAQRQLHQFNLQQMQSIHQRREAALEHYRQEYERTHPAATAQSAQRSVYQSEGPTRRAYDEDDGEDEID